MPLFGTPVRRVEDEALLLGAARFVADLDLPGALHVAYLTAPVASAVIRSIDARAARAAAGVVDVVTAADIDLAPLAPSGPGWPAEMARPLLAVDRVRFVGEPLAAVVAETAALAEDALELIEVDYEPLPAVIDPADALRGEVLVFNGAGSNVVATARGGSSEPLPFTDCEVVISETFRNQRLAPCPIETRVAASEWSADGRLVHYASCQGAHPVRAQLARVYDLDPSLIRVVTRDVGGSFGSKARAYPEELLLGLLARRSGRPVRWVPPRSVDMVGLGHSRAQRQTVQVGGDRDGTIRCLEVQLLADAGAYPLAAPLLATNTGNLQPGPYRIPHVAWSHTAVVTNTTPVVAYRGAGRPEAAALLERAVDRFAAEIGMDPVEVRRRNLLPPDAFPWTSPTGLVYDSGDYQRALDLALDTFGYQEARAEQARRLAAGATEVLGIGMSVFIDRTAGVRGSEYGAVQLRPDGTVLVHTGSSPYGQGHHTAWAMLVADRTGLPLERIEVVHGDTDVVARGGITGGSRSAQKAGSAVASATDALVVAATERAADLLEADPADVVLDLAAGRFHVAGAPAGPAVTWTDLGAAGAAGASAGEGAGLRCESDFEGEGPTFPFGAYVALVAVDLETGGVSLERLVTVDDAGTILNPLLALGQVHGGAAQGVAQALFEEFSYDADGNPLTATFADYLVPSAADLPSFEALLTETPSPNNPLGLKGIAESGAVGAPPAVQNAVIDAVAHLGVRHLDLPVTPERVWRAVREAVGERPCR